MIPIPWVLTVNSEMALFLSIQSLRVCLFSFKTRAVQQKIIAKLVNFSTEEIKENDLIIKAATGNIKTRQFETFYFH